MTDPQLMAQAANGDRTAFQLLYDRHWKAVHRYAWVLTRSVPDAEDITQECFLALIRSALSFDSSRAQVRTWLIAVARNQYLLRGRNRARDAMNEDRDATDPGIPPDEELIKGERAHAVQRAVQALPLLQRETMYLFEFEGLSLADTAAVLEIGPNAVKARLHRAREQLKRLLIPLRPALSRGGTKENP